MVDKKIREVISRVYCGAAYARPRRPFIVGFTESSRALERIQSQNRQQQLQDSLHQLSIIGCEKVRPEIEDQELARVAAGAGLWTASFSLVSATAADALAPEPNPFLPNWKSSEWETGPSVSCSVLLLFFRFAEWAPQ